MSAYMLKSDYYSRTFIGKTADKPSVPERNGDIFISVDDDEKYIGYDGAWNKVTVAL